MNRKKILVNICTIINEIPKKRPKHFWKKQVSYLEQFLILYHSIKKNWKFNYRIWLFHSVPFSAAWLSRLKPLDIRIVMIKPDANDDRYFVRPYVYSYKMDGTHKLVLDCDMIALKQPKFDYSVDAMATYAGYYFNRWKTVCKKLGCEYPSQPMIFKNSSRHAGEYHPHGFINYHTKKIDRQYFPIFNNGAVLVKEQFGRRLGPLWKRFRLQGRNFFGNLGKSGELTIGLAINHLTKNWKAFPPGFNFRISRMCNQFIENYKGELTLLHYVNSKNSPIMKRYMGYYRVLQGKKSV